MEIGIEPTVRHGADLGYIPVVVSDACGFGHCDAAARSIASLVVGRVGTNRNRDERIPEKGGRRLPADRHGIPNTGGFNP